MELTYFVSVQLSQWNVDFSMNIFQCVSRNSGLAYRHVSATVLGWTGNGEEWGHLYMNTHTVFNAEKNSVIDYVNTIINLFIISYGFSPVKRLCLCWRATKKEWSEFPFLFLVITVTSKCIFGTCNIYTSFLHIREWISMNELNIMNVPLQIVSSRSRIFRS